MAATRLLRHLNAPRAAVYRALLDPTDAAGGTDLVATHDHPPPGLSPADNELGWSLSLAKLAALVER